MHLLDLPEDIIIEIFRNLTEVEIYFTVRNVCELLRNYADGYIQLGKC